MFNVDHLTFVCVQSLTLLGTVKVDLLTVQHAATVDTESDPILLGGALGSVAEVLDSNLGFSGFEHRAVNVTFLVFFLADQWTTDQARA